MLTGAQSNKVNVHDVSFTGISNDQGVWNRGIATNGSSFGTYQNIIFNGSNNLGTIFYFRDSNVGVDNHISNIRGTATHTGIDIGGRYEGFYIDNFVNINTLNGIIWDGDLQVTRLDSRCS